MADADEGWASLAAWYDAKQGEEGDLWHRAIIDPVLLDVLGPVRGLRLLEVACGNGYLARRFAREGARVTAIDASAPIVALAQRREADRPSGVEYRVAQAERLDGLPDAGFDVAVSNMALMDIAAADGAITEVARVVRPGGRFVFSISHPCFDLLSRSAWEIERRLFETTVYRKVSRYRELHAESTPWRIAEGSVRSTIGYHRPLSWYVGTLGRAGFAIDRFEEPLPGAEAVRESSQGPLMLEIPLHCVVGCVRR